ncbi:hypothetical protein, partial [Kitasatospora sp. NPDC056531]|uniref:hypothetical protein n=1 Tax=Kitasatospora sp. NPDC056531 TaxID=3345856 RepID=UPI0036BB41F9
LSRDHHGVIAELSPLADDWSRPTGPDLPDLIATGHLLALARHLGGEHEAALRLAADLSATAVDTLGGSSDAATDARESHALMLALGARPLRAVVRLEELAENCTAVQGARNDRTLSIRQSLALARLRAGDGIGAVLMYERVIADRIAVGDSAPTTALIAGHRDTDDLAVSVGAARPGGFPHFPSLAVGLAHALAATERLDLARELLEAVCTGREALMDPGHPLAVEARTSLSQLDNAEPGTKPVPAAPALAELTRRPPAPHPRRSRGSMHRPAQPAVARPAWCPRLTLTEEPAVGATTHLELRLEPADNALQADPSALPDLRLVAAVTADAALDPPVADYTPAGAPARFALTPAAPGPHTVRITVFDRGHGAVLQDLSAVVDVPADTRAQEQE